MSRTRLPEVKHNNAIDEGIRPNYVDPINHPDFIMTTEVYPYDEHNYSYGTQVDTNGSLAPVRGPFLPYDLKGAEVSLVAQFQYLPQLVHDRIFYYYRKLAPIGNPIKNQLLMELRQVMRYGNAETPIRPSFVANNRKARVHSHSEIYVLPSQDLDQ